MLCSLIKHILVVSCCLFNCENHFHFHIFIRSSPYESFRIQLFRERLSEKVHATIPKGIVGGFEFTVLQRKLEKWHERSWTRV